MSLVIMIVAASVQDRINGIINVCTGKAHEPGRPWTKNYKIKSTTAHSRPSLRQPGTWGDPT